MCAHRAVHVCLMLCRLTEEFALTSRQLMLVHSKALRWVSRPLLPAAWTPGDFKTSDEIEEQRVKLELLANRIFRMQVFSFVCKIVSVVSLRFAQSIDASERSIIFSFTVLTVQAVPNACTLLLLCRYFFNRGGTRAGNATSMNAKNAHAEESAEDCLIDDSVTKISSGTTTPMVLPVVQESAEGVGVLITESVAFEARNDEIVGTRLLD